jgi:hypothetical protein
MPTARNARGIDIVAYNSTASHFVGIQVKALSKRVPVALGSDVLKIGGDFWIIVARAATDPVCFVLVPEEIERLAHRDEKVGEGILVAAAKCI